LFFFTQEARSRPSNLVIVTQVFRLELTLHDSPPEVATITPSASHAPMDDMSSTHEHEAAAKISSLTPNF
jgi:hypothetical protein